MEALITCKNLRYSYQDVEVLHGIDFEVHRGEIIGLLGKNGAGKSTIINILMGFLPPDSGLCSIFGYPSHSLPPSERVRIGLLHEGFTQYNFMTIEEIERFYSAFYPRWDKHTYYNLIDKMGIPYNRKVTRLSCGQRSQVTLGLILAQQAELMILDDYSLGLDVGYRRLFLDFLRDYASRTDSTILLTSHIVAELENLLDTLIVIQKGNVIANESRIDFLKTFRRFDVPITEESLKLKSGQGPFIHVEQTRQYISLFTRSNEEEIQSYLLDISKKSGQASGAASGPELWKDAVAVPMTIEDAFVGLTGMY